MLSTLAVAFEPKSSSSIVIISDSSFLLIRISCLCSSSAYPSGELISTAVILKFPYPSSPLINIFPLASVFCIIDIDSFVSSFNIYIAYFAFATFILLLYMFTFSICIPKSGSFSCTVPIIGLGFSSGKIVIGFPPEIVSLGSSVVEVIGVYVLFSHLIFTFIMFFPT